MKRRNVAVFMAAGALVLAAGLTTGLGLAAPADGKWIHIRVVDGVEKASTVKVNMPVTALVSMADVIQDEHIKDGHVMIGHEGIDAAKLRDVWQSLRTAQDMDFITVESDGEQVRVAKSGRFMIARVNGRSHGRGSDDADGEQVQLRVPLEVVDALLDAPEGQLNIKSALETLASQHSGELVTVTDGSSKVRIWIDDKAEAD
ncbi:MAG TPA: hypothetical protein VFQ07_15015 [Candidatus Polarisedimenticolia bacterium]|nr:hypothetical protein [Candidatus Polarisedimenticolia bacterium]